jgi:pantetheine-phosphate adenylyltransferase
MTAHLFSGSSRVQPRFAAVSLGPPGWQQICTLPQDSIQNKIRAVSPDQEFHLNLVRAIYPGSFDPLTNGHLDLIERGSKIFDELIVGILRNEAKDPLFTVAERLDMLEKMVRRFDNVRVDSFEGLLVDYAIQKQAKAVLRGIRAISDYEYELQMALMNRKLQPQLETVFMMPAEAYSYLSSRLVKEVFRLGGSVRGLVPELVEERLREKFHRTTAAR